MSTHTIKNIFTPGAIAAAFIAESIQKHSTKITIGAHSIFLGQVRSDVIDQKVVTAIEYTAYEELALTTLHEIREALFKKIRAYLHACSSQPGLCGCRGNLFICIYLLKTPRSGYCSLWRSGGAYKKRVAHLGERAV